MWKQRKKQIFGVLCQHQRYSGSWQSKGGQIVEGHLLGDHVHLCISIPPKQTVSSVAGYTRRNSTVAIGNTQHTVQPS
ncbi:MAG TPA: transposase [Gallionella sp.]|nr:transposase [Gallionella sp.]